MGKLRLDLDQLTVDSFDTSETAAEKGTVFGEQCTCYTNCTCPGCPTCDNTCGDSCNGTCVDNTCEFSCYGTCHEYSCWDTCAGQYTCDTATGDQIICMC
jgi:hypothetical protein